MTTDLRSHFGFHTLPFTRELRVEHRFETPFFGEALTALLNVLEQRRSGALLAPAGSGKTALLRALVAKLPEARFRVHYVKVTDLSKRDLCREICVAVGAAHAGSYPMLVRRLDERFLASADQDAVRPVILFDEAHDMRIDVLGLLRILTNFDMDSRLVVSILLVGQPSLRATLRHDSLEAVTRRLAHIATLRTLVREESARYVAHRCNVAGATFVPFSPGAQDALFEIAQGNLRATDHLALKALEVAHQGGQTIADANHVVEARKVLWP
jgi:general secretion pathway protein A